MEIQTTAGRTARWLGFAKECVEAALSFLYPEVCQCCREQAAGVDAGYVCGNCQRGIRWIEPPYCERCGLPFAGALSTGFECTNCRETKLHFSEARSAVAARGLVLDVIRRYKYDRALWFEPFLAGLLVRAAAPAIRQARWDWIVPVPLHTAKMNEREFNQAERLGRYLAQATGVPLRSKILKRVQPTRTQTKLTRAERTANVRHAFRLRAADAVAGERIVLVDDVFTTGATCNACARVLRAGGAGEVCVWTVARGLLE